MSRTIYTIYKATNKVNGKSYIGFDSNWPKRKRDHKWEASNSKSNAYNTLFHKAIRKYGFDNFAWSVLFQAKGSIEIGTWFLNTIEPYFIQEYQSHAFTDGHIGYNMTLGGDGCLGMDRKTIGLKISTTLKGKEVTQETRQKISNSLLGKSHPHSEETRKKMAMSSNCTKCLVDGLVYQSMTEAAKAHNISLSTARYRLRTPSYSSWTRI